MTGTALAIVVVVVLVVLLLLSVLGRAELRRRRLRQRFGPEYERVVRNAQSRRDAEQELAVRARRHAELPIRPISTDARERYSARWLEVQELFVDAPVDAVGEADRLVTALMADRGYPTDGYEQQVADLSVEHAGALDDYRAAHDISARTAGGSATTEQLRLAMVHYRSLFKDLLGERQQHRVRANPNTSA
jgi:hypothetical protein